MGDLNITINIVPNENINQRNKEEYKTLENSLQAVIKTIKSMETSKEKMDGYEYRRHALQLLLDILTYRKQVSDDFFIAMQPRDDRLKNLTR